MPEPRFGTGSLRTIYLGRAGSMSKLVVPNSGITMPLSRAAVAHASIDGGVSYTRALDARRTYSINWGTQTPDDADEIMSYYLGARGEGPFCLIDPSFRNQMSLDVSTMGVRYGETDGAPGWSASVDTELPETTLFAAPAVWGSACLVWLEGTPGRSLFEGTQIFSGALLPDTTSATSNGTAVPLLLDQPHCLSIYARTGAGQAVVTWGALGIPDGGVLGPIVDTTRTVPLTTAWQRIWVTVYPSSFGWNTGPLNPGDLYTPNYVCADLKLVSTDVDYGGVVVSNAQHEIGVTRPSPWVAGVGVPRVLIGDPNNVGVTVWDRRDQSLVLTEI